MAAGIVLYLRASYRWLAGMRTVLAVMTSPPSIDKSQCGDPGGRISLAKTFARSRTPLALGPEFPFHFTTPLKLGRVSDT